MTETKAKYRATFILDTRGADEDADQTIESLKSEIEATGAEVTKVENLGRTDFARVTDAKYTSGIYAQYEVQGSKETPVRIKEKLRLNKTISHKMIQTI